MISKLNIDPFSGPDAPNETDLYSCVHCGFCLQACPTYVLTGLEAESPRGRIALMKAVNEERIEVTPSVINHWDLCIQCRACEVACPSGVPYGKLIEATMAQVMPRRKSNMLSRLVSNLLLKLILPYQVRLGLVIGGLRIYQLVGAQVLMRRIGFLKKISPGLASLEESMPKIPSTTFKAQGQVILAQGPKRARVALLSGCIMPLVHGPQMDAVIRVLARNGCDVVVTREQSCCGAINSHVGDLDLARDLARRNIDAFMSEDVDAVIVASAGCGARMKEYAYLLRRDQEYVDRAATLAGKVKDVHEFLAELPLLSPKGRLDVRVTYQDSCHLSNAQCINDAPRELLKSIPGLDLVEMEGEVQCCGAGGTYTVTQREFSLRLLDSRMDVIAATGAQGVATANPGCVLQLDYGARIQDAGVKVRYVTDLLYEAYESE